ncbi:MAG: DUF2007 domain-containing protein [Planctomycetaceae bacterium]|jgi:hypothetical protein|nr:DUF2007 domain-containing protein [Planctomycetaceae bacterium]
MTGYQNENTVTVYSTSNLFDAEIVANKLQQEGIQCSILNANQAGFSGLGITAIEVIVREEDAIRAEICITTSET